MPTNKPPHDLILRATTWLTEDLYPNHLGEPFHLNDPDPAIAAESKRDYDRAVSVWISGRFNDLWDTVKIADPLAKYEDITQTIYREAKATKEPTPVTPPTPGGPVQATTRLRIEGNARWFGNDAGRFDYREVTAFGLYANWLNGKRESAIAFVREQRKLGFTVSRVLFTLDNPFWRGRGCVVGPETPGFWEELPPFFNFCASEGMYVRSVMIGDLIPLGGPVDFDWTRRPDVFRDEVERRATIFCQAFTSATRGFSNHISELANEPIQIGLKDSLSKLVAIGRMVKNIAPDLILCGGSPDGNADQRVDLIREPFDFCDAHIERFMGIDGFEWVKRSGEYMPIDQPAEHWPSGAPRKPMPFVSGEPANFGDPRLDGQTGDVVESTAVAFAYGAVSRCRQFNTCFHYDGGLFGMLPGPLTTLCIHAYMQGLDAFPMNNWNKWRGHWQESYFRGDIYPATDEARDVERHVTRGLGPFRVFGAGAYCVTLAEPAGWNWQAGLKDGYRDRVERVASATYGAFASAVYRLR